MIFILNILLIVFVVTLSLPVIMFCLEIFLAILPCRRTNSSPLSDHAQLAILIPAHNEQAVIAATLRTLMPTVPVGSRVVVVADNCTDSTAAIARECGAEVIE